MKTTIESAIEKLKQERDQFDWMVNGLESGDIKDLESRLMETHVLNALGGTLRAELFGKVEQSYMGGRKLQVLKLQYYDFERYLRYRHNSSTRDIIVNLRDKEVNIEYDFLMSAPYKTPTEFLQFMLHQYEHYLKLTEKRQEKFIPFQWKKSNYLENLLYSLTKKIEKLKEDIDCRLKDDKNLLEPDTYNVISANLLKKREDTETIIDVYTSNGFELNIPEMQNEERYRWFTSATYERNPEEHPLFAPMASKKLERPGMLGYHGHSWESLGHFLQTKTCGIALESDVPLNDEERKLYYRQNDEVIYPRSFTEGEFTELKRLFEADEQFLKIEKSPKGTLKVSHKEFPLTLTLHLDGLVVVKRLKEWGKEEPLETRVGLQAFAYTPSFRMASRVLDCFKIVDHYEDY